MSIRACRQRQSDFKEILSSNSGLNPSRFFRLMTFAALEVLCCIAVAITITVFYMTQGEIQPWISWEDTHRDFSQIDLIPSRIWRYDPTTNVSLEMSRWIVVVCGFIFVLFGFADKAQGTLQANTSNVVQRRGHPSNLRMRA